MRLLQQPHEHAEREQQQHVLLDQTLEKMMTMTINRVDGTCKNITTLKLNKVFAVFGDLYFFFVDYFINLHKLSY